MIAGTNGCSRNFLKKALELNPDMHFLDELEVIYKKHGDVFEILAYRNKDGVNDYQNGGLEGGFNIISQAIKDKNRMKNISDTIMNSVKYCDEILEVFSNI